MARPTLATPQLWPPQVADATNRVVSLTYIRRIATRAAGRLLARRSLARMTWRSPHEDVRTPLPRHAGLRRGLYARRRQDPEAAARSGCRARRARARRAWLHPPRDRRREA